MKTAVIGGGITGLAAAWELAATGADVTVYEPGHPGGKLLTSDFLGRPVDEGPDALLARVPEGVGLCRELGLGDELVAPAASKALLWSGGKLRPLPDGLVLGAPSRLAPLASSGILSVPGLARALGDLVLPRHRVGGDESVYNLIARRFGPQVADRLVDPLVGGIYAATTKDLSAATVAPQLLAAAQARRSLLASLRQGARGTPGASPSGAGSPVFLAPKGGMQVIADRLVQRLAGAGTSTRFLPTEVTGLRSDGAGVIVSPGDDRYDGAVVAAPGPAALRLLGPLLGASARALAELDGARFASVGIITLGFDTGAVVVPAGYSGLLVAPGSDLLVTACSFGSNKWPHWSGPSTVVLRVSVGKAGDERWAALSDDDLVSRVLDELATILGPTGAKAPVPWGGAWRVSRWPRSLPPYPVGHLQDMAALQSELRRQAPTVALAGASYGRVGVPACIASGRQAGALISGSPAPSPAM